MTASKDIPAERRTTARIPTASDDELEAWVYRPEGKGPHPRDRRTDSPPSRPGGSRRPVRKAADIRSPILLVVGENDTIAPAAPALRVATRAPRGELYRSRGGHYDVYEGGEDFDNVLNLEVDFLHRHAQVLTA